MRRYPGASSIDIIDHLKASLRKVSDETFIHAGTNDITNNINCLSNVKKIVVRDTSNNTKLFFSSIICRIDIRDIDGNIIETNSHLENYWKQQNLGFINNKNINKSDVPSILNSEEKVSWKKILQSMLTVCYRWYYSQWHKTK